MSRKVKIGTIPPTSLPFKREGNRVCSNDIENKSNNLNLILKRVNELIAFETG